MAGFTKFLFIPLVLLLGQVDFKDENVLFLARCAFYVAVAVTLATNALLKSMVVNNNDTTSIWVPPPQTGFFPDPNAKLVKSTYHEYEMNLVSENFKKALIMVAMMSFMTFKLGLHLPLGIQGAMLPLELFTSPIVAKYLFKSSAATPYGESLEPPEDNEDDAAGAGAGAGASAGDATSTDAEVAGTARGGDPSPATSQLLDFIITKWNNETSFTAAELEPFLEQGADINAQTPVEAVNDNPDELVGGMTALMIACGFPGTAHADVSGLIAKRASLNSTDNDSWTALHWAAEYGAVDAARALLENATAGEKAFMIRHVDNNGKTPADLARDSENDAIVKIIAEHAELLDDNDDDVGAASSNDAAGDVASSTAGIRQRTNVASSNATPGSDDVEDID